MKKLVSFLTIALCIILLTSVAYSAKTIVVNETDLVQLDLKTHDADGDKLDYNFSEPLNEQGEWQTDYGDEGEYNVLITVSDGTNTVKDYVLIIVKHKNRAPEIQTIEDIVVEETDIIEINPVVTDYENDSVDIEITGVGEDGYWETGYDDAGEYTITITASDSLHTVSKDISIIVKEKNRAPVIESYAPENTTSIDENENIKFSVKAKDNDNDNLEYSWYVNDVQQNQYSSSFEFETGYDSSGSYTITARISDSKDFVEKTWNINVNNQNRAPVIEECPEKISVKEGETIELEFTASDPDQDELKYKISEPIGNDRIWKTTHSDSGEYDVKLAVSDTIANTTKNIKITVEDVDVAPVIEEIPDLEVYEGETLEYEFIAEDPDNDSITYELHNAPEGLAMKGNKITFAPDYDFVNPNSANFLRGFINSDKKEIRLKLIAKSNDLYDKEKFDLIVHNKNRAPVIEDLESSIQIKEGDSIIISPSYSDPDKDKVTVHISNPVGDDGEWYADYSSAGNYQIDVVATDGSLETVKTINLNVSNVNREPYFQNKKTSFEINENNTVVIVPDIKDPDGGIVELKAKNLPNGSSLKDGMFEWTPDFDTTKENKKFTITFIANDSESVAVENFDIIVNNVNRAPDIINTSQDKAKCYVGESITFVVDAVDKDNDKLNYDWHFRMLDSEKDGSALKRTFTVPGKKEITVTVSDGQKAVEHTFTAEVYQKKMPEEKSVKKPKKVVKKSKPKITTYVMEHEDNDSGMTIVTM